MADFLTRGFFERPFLTVAEELIGCTLVWDGCAGVIVEVEAYASEGDEACHTMTRPSAREFVARHPPGTAYVYLNYGMYWLLNVLAGDGIVLFRALEPVAGLEAMRRRRGREAAEDLCSGPGKLGRALGLSAADHGRRMAFPEPGAEGQACGIAPRVAGSVWDVERDVRIGISKAVELPWRFLLRGHPHVSVPPKRPGRK